jgi:hypothetical protein
MGGGLAGVGLLRADGWKNRFCWVDGYPSPFLIPLLALCVIDHVVDLGCGGRSGF